MKKLIGLWWFLLLLWFCLLISSFLQAVWFSFGKINSFSFSVSRSLIPQCSFLSGFVQSAVSAFRDFKFYFSAKALVPSSEEKQRYMLGFYKNFMSLVKKKLGIKIEL